MDSFPIDSLTRSYTVGTPRWRITDSGVTAMALGIGANRIRDALGQAIWAIDCRLDGLSSADRDLLEDFYADNRASEFYWYDPLRALTYEVTFDYANPPQIVPRGDGSGTYDVDMVLIPAVPTVAADTLIAHYLMNDNAANTTVADDTGNGHTGTANQNTQDMDTTGKLNGALAFDGVDDYVNVAAHADLRLTGGGTIAAWIKAAGLGENDAGRIVDKSTDTSATNGFYFAVASTTKIQCRINGNAAILSANSAWTLNTWSHVAVTFDGRVVRFYANGALLTETAYAYLPPDVAGDVRIGNRAGATDRTFNGAIDDLRIYERALTAAEIALIYNAGSGSESEIVV
jgi:hypothetical protein